ncbi:Phospholipid scramblase 2 [Orchesella cincta]|uniref:Phospholipid scramblase n=1 Tax=Orchesella cincta TaxID=48709 RepID=A0A1D2N191_ORCCI|nr:Phospholipid scramblase 2 [Orchesella cincta]
MADEQDSPEEGPHHQQQQHQQVQLSLSPGLEFLIPTQGLVIQQQIEWGEIMLGVNFNNKYHIVDDLGRRLFFAAENSDALSLICMGKCRPWNIILFNMQGHPVMSGKRESSCCCNGLCDNTVIVTSATGLVLGRLSQNSSCCTASWNIHDAEGNIILLLQGPECSIFCPGVATCYEASFEKSYHTSSLFPFEGHSLKFRQFGSI